MATIIRDIEIGASAEFVWSAVRDVGSVHVRLFPGFVTDVTMEPGIRHVRFATGWVVHELIVSIDDDLRRIAYASVQGRAQHHNSSMQVFPITENRSRILWTTDVLPDSVAASIAEILNHAIPLMVRTPGNGEILNQTPGKNSEISPFPFRSPADFGTALAL